MKSEKNSCLLKFHSSMILPWAQAKLNNTTLAQPSQTLVFMNYLQDTLALQPVLNIAKKKAKLKNLIMQRVPFSTL